MGVLGYLPKLLYQIPKFQCHTIFLSQDIKQIVSLSSYLDN